MAPMPFDVAYVQHNGSSGSLEWTPSEEAREALLYLAQTSPKTHARLMETLRRFAETASVSFERAIALAVLLDEVSESASQTRTDIVDSLVEFVDTAAPGLIDTVAESVADVRETVSSWRDRAAEKLAEFREGLADAVEQTAATEPPPTTSRAKQFSQKEVDAFTSMLSKQRQRSSRPLTITAFHHLGNLREEPYRLSPEDEAALLRRWQELFGRSATDDVISLVNFRAQREGDGVEG